MFMLCQVSGIETRLVDLSDWGRAREVVEELGHVDLLVNNAGITNWTSFLEVTQQELDEYVSAPSTWPF